RLSKKSTRREKKFSTIRSYSNNPKPRNTIPLKSIRLEEISKIHDFVTDAHTLIVKLYLEEQKNVIDSFKGTFAEVVCLQTNQYNPLTVFVRNVLNCSNTSANSHSVTTKIRKRRKNSSSSSNQMKMSQSPLIPVINDSNI